MLSRRDLGKVVAVSGLGPRRADRAMVAQVPPGVVPGGRAGIFKGRLVIVFGSGFSGVFVYNPSPAAGNLKDSIAGQPGTDPYGNAYLAGITSYGASQLFSQLIGGTVALGSQNPSSLIVIGAAMSLIDALAAATAPQLNLNSPAAHAGGAAPVFLSLRGESNDGTKLPQALISAGPGTPSTTALLEVDGNINAPGATITGGALQANLGGLDISFAGGGVAIKEGSNAKQGTATLAAGTSGAIANTSVTANSRIFLTAQDNNSTGALRVSARVAGTSFTITSSNGADSGVVAWLMNEPG